MFYEKDLYSTLKSSLIAALPVIGLPIEIIKKMRTKISEKKEFLKSDYGKDMIKYYKKASILGNEKATKRLQELQKHMEE